ncbi:6480_t:CDS:2 [Funneliformis mosseae]|uniref:6480_t:CDS:1 n=1 Tax=Funneliformis mosseae TaxID=27381 RepID=A0A9N9GT91_FUNMO|nr:6480_t:CDS:2 [Funneliformis mosseae]
MKGKKVGNNEEYEEGEIEETEIKVLTRLDYITNSSSNTNLSKVFRSIKRQRFELLRTADAHVCLSQFYKYTQSKYTKSSGLPDHRLRAEIL